MADDRSSLVAEESVHPPEWQLRPASYCSWAMPRHSLAPGWCIAREEYDSLNTKTTGTFVTQRDSRFVMRSAIPAQEMPLDSSCTMPMAPDDEMIGEPKTVESTLTSKRIRSWSKWPEVRMTSGTNCERCRPLADLRIWYRPARIVVACPRACTTQHKNAPRYEGRGVGERKERLRYDRKTGTLFCCMSTVPAWPCCSRLMR
jgi:hypothetical protein